MPTVSNVRRTALSVVDSKMRWRAILGEPREADAGRCKPLREYPEVGIERMSHHAERLGVHGRRHGGWRVVVGDPLRHGELRRPVVVVVRSIADVDVDVPGRPRHEGEVDRRRARLAVDGRALQRAAG